MKKIKIGILGYSNIAKKSIIPAILDHPMYELSYIASRSIEKQQEIRKQCSVETGAYDQILKVDLEAIYVSVPVGLHYELGKKVLQSNKHLLLEKTFTHSFETTKELLEIASKQNKVAMEALMYQYHPLFKKVKEIIFNGEIGEVKHIEAYFGFPHLNSSDIRYDAKLGGGAILDASVYPLSLVLFLLGEQYKQVYSSISLDKELQIDENGTIFIEYENSSAIIKFGFGLAYRNEYQIWGTEGILKVNRGFSRPVDFTNSIIIEKNTKQQEIEVPAADHFYNMLDVFYEKIKMYEHLQDRKLLARMTLIDKIYKDGYTV